MVKKKNCDKKFSSKCDGMVCLISYRKSVVVTQFYLVLIQWIQYDQFDVIKIQWNQHLISISDCRV